ncbi:hypothetical protein [Angustibacter sp. Root456]|uniref:hypothetical protein n=1 Tax=Angustibacter sp. Root456 TaxID=1736539 RepID=UPI0006FF4455|nr:hypothetical protein [Angustibacter sp. Root456]KQX69386.1 hypothetical protein ASD06_16790 [Angustibacter sp. Root456]
MSTLHRTAPASTSGAADPVRTAHAARQAFVLLRTAFTVAPIAFGLDKFVGLLTDWPRYLAPWIDHLVPGTAQQAMYAVGVVEVVAGLVVLVAPRVGGYLVAAWLLGIIVDLVTLGGYGDVVLRDVGLLAGALALARLATAFPAPVHLRRRGARR